MTYPLNLPLTHETLVDLSYGTRLAISGTILAAGPEVHREIEKGTPLPEDLPEGTILYHCRPRLVRMGRKWGVESIEPERSAQYESSIQSFLSRRSIRAFLGYGGFSTDAMEWFRRLSGCYMQTYAGCGSALAEHVVSVKEIPFGGLKGSDALWALEVEGLPALVTMDLEGRSLYELRKGASTKTLGTILG